jgi:hypothetical protein
MEEEKKEKDLSTAILQQKKAPNKLIVIDLSRKSCWNVRLG